MAAGSLVGILTPAGLGWDFANFYDAGRRVLSGQARDLYDPAQDIGGEPPQGRQRFYGTPISAVLYAPMGALAPSHALVAFKIQNVAALALTFFALYRFYRRLLPRGDPDDEHRFLSWFLGMCLLFQPFWTIFRVGGQTTPTALVLVVAAMVLHTSGRSWGAAAFVVAAALIKPALAPAVLCLVVLAGWRLARAIGVCGLAAGVISIGAMGLEVHRQFLERLLQSTGETWSWHYNSSVFIVLDNLRAWAAPGPESAVAVLFSLLGWLLVAGAVVVVAVLARAGRNRDWTDPARRHFHFMLALLFFLLSSRTIWEHYLAFLFPWLVLVAVRGEALGRAARLTLLATLGLSIFQNFIFTDWLRSAFAITSLPALMAAALYKSGPLLLSALLALRYRAEWLGIYASPAWQGLAASAIAIAEPRRRIPQ